MIRPPPPSTLSPTRRSSDLTLEDRWLLYPVQQDELQASGWRDLLPRHEFTPDDRAVIADLGGRIVRIDLASAAQTERSEEHTSELQSLTNLVCRLLSVKKHK